MTPEEASTLQRGQTVYVWRCNRHFRMEFVETASQNHYVKVRGHGGGWFDCRDVVLHRPETDEQKHRRERREFTLRHIVAAGKVTVQQFRRDVPFLPPYKAECDIPAGIWLWRLEKEKLLHKRGDYYYATKEGKELACK